jgi:GDP-D-mannose dehydratase
MKKILITGCSGYIGSHLSQMVNNEYEVHGLDLNIPQTIGNFRDLTAIHLVGCVASIPESICNLQKLQFLSLPENPNLQKLPECIGSLPRLSVINIKGSNKNAIPESLQARVDTDEVHLFV